MIAGSPCDDSDNDICSNLALLDPSLSLHSSPSSSGSWKETSSVSFLTPMTSSSCSSISTVLSVPPLAKIGARSTIDSPKSSEERHQEYIRNNLYLPDLSAHSLSSDTSPDLQEESVLLLPTDFCPSPTLNSVPINFNSSADTRDTPNPAAGREKYILQPRRLPVYSSNAENEFSCSCSPEYGYSYIKQRHVQCKKRNQEEEEPYQEQPYLPNLTLDEPLLSMLSIPELEDDQLRGVTGNFIREEMDGTYTRNEIQRCGDVIHHIQPRFIHFS